MPETAGRTVGPYHVQEVLGEGGMGIVYRGVHHRLRRPVVVKQLAPELTRNPQFRERFFSEARTQAQLQHPGIVTIYDLLEERGEYFIVMEYFPGRSLDRLMAEPPGHSLGEERSLRIFRQVLEALDSAHAVGVIHRDVKPSNVLVGEGDRVKLMDFGIALLVGDKRLTQSSQTIGTPVYMSPEQILRPREVDHRTDIYSAAVMLYEMLAGKPPYDADTEYEIKKQHVEVAPARPLEELSGCDPAVLAALLRSLDKDPEKRFSGAGQLLRALPAPGAAVAPPDQAPAPVAEVPAPPPPPASVPEERAPARTGSGPWWWPRHRAVQAGAAAAGLLLVGLVVLHLATGGGVGGPPPSDAVTPDPGPAGAATPVPDAELEASPLATPDRTAPGAEPDRLVGSRGDAVRRLGYAPSRGYVVEMDSLTVEPAEPSPGGNLVLTLRWVVLGPDERETLRLQAFVGLKRDGWFVLGDGPRPVAVEEGGGILESRTVLLLPEDVEVGPYEVEALVEDTAGRFEGDLEGSLELVRGEKTMANDRRGG